MSDKILVVDDDPHIREVVEFALTKAGFKVVTCGDGAQALKLFKERQPSLVVLDILMPELDGMEVCKRIRAESETPIIFLTSVDDEVDRILGLERGADDYITKPFGARELVARIQAVLRRSKPKPAPEDKPEVIIHGPLKIDRDRFKVFWNETEVQLTSIEFRILETLAARPGKIYTRDEIMDRAWQDTVVCDRNVDGHIKRIRKKFAEIGGTPIKTVHGVGYGMNDPT